MAHLLAHRSFDRFLVVMDDRLLGLWPSLVQQESVGVPPATQFTDLK